jgi:uncharacterized membrane protein YjgN (DUF898 family)
MSDAIYMVVFRGQLVEGAEPEQVKESLQRLFRLSRDKVEQLFTLSAVVLKKNIGHELAHSLKRQLEKEGVITEVKAMAEATMVALQDAPLSDAPLSDTRSQSVESAARDRVAVAFHGKGGEYFKIWIVNILLSIVTLGIYSAWAKVRNHRYFYSNTEIGSGSFEYTASPLAILKGRIIAVLFLLLFSYSATALPLLYGVLGVVLLGMMPWLINRSLAFRQRNTVYRNVRFGFDGNYMGALKAFILWPIAGALSLGLLMPYALFRQKQYMVQCSRYGTTPFAPEFGWRELYGVALRALLLLIAAGGIVGLSTLLGPFGVLGMIAALALYLMAFAYFTANISNVVYNGSRLLGHGFESTLRTRELALLYLTNGLLLFFTLGLAIPWVMVRLARYRAANLTVLVDGSLDTFVASAEQQVNALGEEIGEAFDFDIGL